MKKKKADKYTEITPNQVGAVLEAIHKDVKMIAEGHSGLDARLENIEREIHGNSRRLDMVELSLSTTSTRIGHLEDATSKLSKDIKETRQSLETKISELGTRLTTVESGRG